MFLSVSQLSAQNIPIDFEANGNGAEWQWTVFENDSNPALEIIENPDPTGINKSATVAKFTALSGGMPFAGCESMHGSDIGTFTIDDSTALIKIKVWKSVISDVGIKLVRADNWSLGEIKIANTVVNAWEEIEFDFSAHIGNVYDQIVIFPDFGNRSMDNVIYFDDIFGGTSLTSSTNQIEEIKLEVFPNPASEQLYIKSDKPIYSYQVYALDGRLVKEVESRVAVESIDITTLETGSYLLHVISDGKETVEQFIKQ